MISVEDLASFADIPQGQAQAMIDDALAVAATVAPCVKSPVFEHADAARAILRRAILRWAESGVSGSITQQSAGPYSQSVTAAGSRGLFLPSELDSLRGLCRGAGGGAFTIMPGMAGPASQHSDVCSVLWGAPCSCGSIINRYEGPLYEGGLLS